MEKFIDELGITYSAKLADSISDFNDIITLYLDNKNTVMPELDALILKDTDMPMAHILSAYLLKLSGDPKFTRPIKQVIKKLDENLITLNPREEQHLLALRAWSDNQDQLALLILEELLKSYPKDMIALRITHYMHFYAGTPELMRDSIQRSFVQWNEDDAFYSHLLGMYSFGLEESGEYDNAEFYGRRAVELNSGDIWATHAVTHVFQMQSRSQEGIDWLDQLIPTWSDSNNFVYHLYWHQALFHIGNQDHDQAIKIYDEHLKKAERDDFYLDICNSTSLLWRLEMLGVDVGNRWQGLSEFAENRILDDELVFSTLHYLMIPARLKNQSMTDKAHLHFNNWSQQDTYQGKVCRDVGLSLANSIIQFGSGDYKDAHDNLEKAQTNIKLIGGSHAQRHLFDDFNQYAKLHAS
jgi:tetratricopeptide (TPR) repeat protein